MKFLSKLAFLGAVIFSVAATARWPLTIQLSWKRQSDRCRSSLFAHETKSEMQVHHSVRSITDFLQRTSMQHRISNELNANLHTVLDNIAASSNYAKYLIPLAKAVSSARQDSSLNEKLLQVALTELHYLKGTSRPPVISMGIIESALRSRNNRFKAAVFKAVEIWGTKSESILRILGIRNEYFNGLRGYRRRERFCQATDFASQIISTFDLQPSQVMAELIRQWDTRSGKEISALAAQYTDGNLLIRTRVRKILSRSVDE